MAKGKVWDPGLHKWVKEDELLQEQDAFVDLVNLIGSEIAKLSMTRDGVRELFRCVEDNLMFSGFEPLMKRSEAPASQSSEPQSD